MLRNFADVNFELRITLKKNAPVPLSCSQLKFSASVRTSNYSSMSVASVFLLSLLLPLVEIHCQPSSYVSFRDQTLVNHSYVDLSQVYFSSDGSDSVQCHTDLSTCCTQAEGIHRGDWYFPDSTQLPFGGPLFESRGPQRVDIYSNVTSKVDPYHMVYIAVIFKLLLFIMNSTKVQNPRRNS